MSHTCLCLPSYITGTHYRPRRDGRLSRPWCEVAPAEIRTCNLPIANPALCHTATSAPTDDRALTLDCRVGVFNGSGFCFEIYNGDGAQKLERCRYQMVEKFDVIKLCIRLATIQQRDRQTDRQTEMVKQYRAWHASAY